MPRTLRYRRSGTQRLENSACEADRYRDTGVLRLPNVENEVGPSSTETES